MKARFYDSDVGWFLTQDTYLGVETEAPSLHRYICLFEFDCLIEVVDWSGRVMRDDTQLSRIHATAGLVSPRRQRGYIPRDLPPIIDRLGVEPDNWITLTKALRKIPKPLSALKRISKIPRYRWATGARLTDSDVSRSLVSPSSISLNIFEQLAVKLGHLYSWLFLDLIVDSLRA